MISRIRVFPLLICTLATSGCGIPFGRSYLVERQQIEVSFRPAQPDRVSVHALYKLKNAGLPAIENLEIRLPDPVNFTVENVQAKWLGHPSSGKAIADFKNEFHFDFGNSLKTKASGEFDLRYDLKFPVVSAASSDNHSAFFLPSFGWYPQLLAAEGPLGSGGAWPGKWELDVTVPENFSVHASGLESGRARRAGAVRWKYQQTLRSYLPFVAAGNYSIREIRGGETRVALWSISPASDARANALADRLASDDRYFAAEFGTSVKAASRLWIIECPGNMDSAQTPPWLATSGCMTVPDAAVVPANFLSATARDEDTAMLHSIDMQLAASRFYFVARIDRNGPLYPLAAVNDYAVFSLEASRAAGSRAEAVRQLIARLEVIPAANTDKALTSVTREDSVEVREAAHVRSELFYVALEDRCSSQAVHRALARIFRVTQGSAWSLNELRSAVEAECSQDLAPLFHEWLDHPGIPAEFRAHYLQGSPGNHQN
ncbi:MAG TPA: hypothetical protein VFO34_17190 [Candidatus Acidoferrales bacterium]|nr:hypothetical protein [Candidatus Acidoferrales bacterium]